MCRNCAVGVMGGDERQVFLARLLREEGYTVLLSCLENAPGAGEFPGLAPGELAERCRTVILPLPAVRDGKTLNAPFAREAPALDDDFAALFSGKTVLGGMTERLSAASPLWKNVCLRDYYAREELLVGNAFLTAEGAAALAVTESPGALCGSRCLVTGFGRIGKALCATLKGMGAQVTCCARRASDLAAVRCLGLEAAAYEALSGSFDYVFNTVPAPVLTAGALSRMGPETLLLELASAPGGIDREAAARLGLRVISAPGLPGKLSPKASARLIRDAVIPMLEEAPGTACRTEGGGGS